MVTTLTYTFSSLTLTPSPLNFGIFLNQVCSAAVKVVARGYEAMLVCFFYIYMYFMLMQIKVVFSLKTYVLTTLYVPRRADDRKLCMMVSMT